MLKNFSTLVVSFCVSLAIAEGGLRAFTSFPIGDDSNRIFDARLGYRVDSALPDVDAQGFRNPPGRDNYSIAAIGDSMTYGFNVESSSSWPRVFEKTTGALTYNFGVGSYGIYSYHPLVLDALSHGAEGVIVALYPANDFAMIWSYCDIVNGNSSFWAKEKERLELRALDMSKRDRLMCRKGLTSRSSFRDELTQHIALLSAFEILIWERLKDHRSGDDVSENNYVFPDNIPPLDRYYLEKSAQLASSSSPTIATMLNDFEKFVNDWSTKADGHLGVLIIPSKERVTYELLRRRGMLNSTDAAFVDRVALQVDLEDRVERIIRGAGIHIRDAVSIMTDALEDSIRSGKPLYPTGEEAHPFDTGYAALAESATALWADMKDGLGLVTHEHEEWQRRAL
jgi:hypothetical protein